MISLLGGVPASTQAADLRPLGETATRLPRGRLATSREGGHSCEVVADGSVKCWGLNTFGQLGDGTTATPLTPVRVSGISAAIAVTTGRDHSCQGARFRVRVRLTQDGGAEGHGHAEGKCEGALDRVAVHVSAQGRPRFDEGPAEASAVMEVRRKGELLDQQDWGRVVELEHQRAR